VTGEPKNGKKSHAILIGVSAYEDADFPSIRAARNSLMAMRRMLADPELCGWNPEEITVISNPHSARDLAVQVTNLARATDGVLMIYYVGHGVLSGRGELCLTVTTTLSDHPQITGLPWNLVADALRESAARMRFAILDCCFAGQAIEAMAGNANEAVADLTHVEGVYTLTATTRNRTAHVPPPDKQDTASTSFTGALIELITSGIPQGPPTLTLGVIYRNLRTRLVALGLPVPNQRNTDLADSFVFSKNAWIQPEIIDDGATDTSEQGTTSTPAQESSSFADNHKLAAQAFFELAAEDTIHVADRFEAADKLATLDQQQAAEAFYQLATEDTIDVGDRFEAADKLAKLNLQQGAKALFEIGTDDSIDTEDRREAAQKLSGLNEELAAKAFDNIASDEGSRIELSARPIFGITTLALILIFMIVFITIVLH
jgi:hypothetical protein